MKFQRLRGSSLSPRMRKLPLLLAAVGMQFGGMSAVQAFEIATGNEDLKLRWDNSIKYTAGWRVKDRSETVSADLNLDAGDRNFDKGLVSSRFDLLSEFDATYKNFGARLSGAAWYDQVYNRDTDYDRPFPNALSVPTNEFTDATRKLHGRKAEFLDAFVFGKFDLGSVPTTVRLGQHTVVYGDTLFFGSNGIANAQGPIDLIKLVTVPGSQFKEILRPVEQVSSVFQISPRLTFGAYYQFRWEESRLPAAGSYLSPADFVGEGAELLFAGPGSAFGRGKDLKAKDSGQGGFQLRWAPVDSEWEFGAYFARYHDKLPYFYLLPTQPPPFNPLVDQFKQVYHEGIRTYGVSATTSIGQLNIAFEGSLRDNVALVSDPQVVGPASDNSGNPAYAVGKSAHVNASAIYVLTPTALWEAGSFLGEIAWNRRLSVDKNRAALDPNTSRDAAALRFIFEPSYFQVASGLDLSVPIGVGYNFYGRSSTVFNFNGGSGEGGDLSVGLNFTYLTDWKGGINYTHYLGSAGGFLTPPNAPGQVLSYDQFYKDRNFVSLTLKRAF